MGAWHVIQDCLNKIPPAGNFGDAVPNSSDQQLRIASIRDCEASVRAEAKSMRYL